MQIGIRALDESLNLQKKKQPLIHCISNSVFFRNLEKSVINYNGNPIISSSLEEYAEITSKANSLIVTLNDLSEDKIEAIEKSIRIARRKAIPVVMDILGVNISFLSKEIALRFINRYNINIVIGKLEEFKVLILKKDKLSKSISSNYKIKEDIEFRKSLRSFSKLYRTILIVKSNEYYLTDGFSEVYIKRYIQEENDLLGIEGILSGLISVGVAAASNTEESFRGVLVAIIAMAVSEKMVEQKNLIYSKNIKLMECLLDEIKNIDSKKLKELQEVYYLFKR
ncbi:hydroxyethylthiazole kinase [uncultured Clostridium sp.]|uniref:hydroxyethylthiazole kinase n=1 Tax=uncultured Clostridium sp. TaxID=59620 RepID=UPI0025854E93|nr:hydroxyethylthiazole kinase [uncultured Clostridium sp.]